jgi:excisionase family DNA binding protein
MEQTMPDKTEHEQSLARITYTVEQAAQLLQVNPATIYRLIARRHLRVVPGIRVKRILHSELERFAGGDIAPQNRKAA